MIGAFFYCCGDCAKNITLLADPVEEDREQLIPILRVSAVQGHGPRVGPVEANDHSPGAVGPSANFVGAKDRQPGT
jgi:hypothetical protein